jgi:flagellar protein FliO/FliZ
MTARVLLALLVALGAPGVLQAAVPALANAAPQPVASLPASANTNTTTTTSVNPATMRIASASAAPRADSIPAAVSGAATANAPRADAIPAPVPVAATATAPHADSIPAPLSGAAAAIAPDAAAAALRQPTVEQPVTNTSAPNSPQSSPQNRPSSSSPNIAMASPMGGQSAGNLLQTIVGLVLVLGLLAGLAWFLKRFGPKAGGGSANLHIVGALNLGGRERIIVVEVGDQWIVVGASPGRVNALVTMPRQEGGALHGASLHPHAAPASSFSEWLKQTIDKRNAK